MNDEERNKLPHSELTGSILNCSFEVRYRGIVIGRYSADLVVEKTVIVELKCCESLVREHQAQLFNYLKVSQLPIGLLINFRRRKLEYKRLHGREGYEDDRETVLERIRALAD
jgi:GxxExxY protein